MRIVKFLGVAVAITLTLALVAVLAINTIPGDQYKRMIGAAVKSATGRDLMIGGDLEIGLGSSFRFMASDVSFANVPGGSRPQMFSGGLIEVEVRLMPLLDGALDVRMVLDAPDLLLETDAEGRGNWQMAAGMEEESADEAISASEDRGLPLSLYVRELRLEQVKVAYLDTVTDQQHHADFNTILLSSQGEQVVVELSGRLDEHELDLQGGVDQIAAGTPSAFTLTGKVGEVGLNAKGTLDAISATANADFVLDANMPSLAALSAFLGTELPDQGPLDASLRISGREGQYRVDDLEVKLGAEMLTAAVTGTVADLVELSGIDLDVSANTSQLAKVVEQLGVEVASELPPVLTVEAKIRGGLDALSAPTYQIGVQDEGIEASVAGRIGDLRALTGLTADLSVETASLTALSKYADTELPDSGPVSLTGKLSSPEGLDAPSDVSANVKANGVNAVLNGRIADLLAAQEVALAVEIEGDSLEQVARLAGQNLASREPMLLKGDLSLGNGTYKADKLLFKSGDNEIKGALEFTQPAQGGGRPKLHGNLHLGNLDLDALLGLAPPAPATDSPQSNADAANQTSDTGAEPTGSEQVADTTAEGAAEDTVTKVFPSDPLPVEVLRTLDADLEIAADEIVTYQLQLHGVFAKLALHDGVLSIEPVNATVGSGPFQASLVLDASRSPTTLAVDIDMDDGTSRNFGGRFNLEMDLDGMGDSIAELMAGLDGQVIVDLRDLNMEKSVLTKFGHSLMNNINPFDKEKEKSELDCAIVRFDIKDGIADADDKIVAKLTKVTWFGGGTINLQTEEIDFGAHSKPRTGLGIDSMVGLAKLVHVGGTLANPRVETDPKGVAKVYGEGYLTVATGGLYLLIKGMWNKSKAKSDVCAEILEMEEKERQKNTQPVLLDTSDR